MAKMDVMYKPKKSSLKKEVARLKRMGLTKSQIKRRLKKNDSKRK